MQRPNEGNFPHRATSVPRNLRRIRPNTENPERSGHNVPSVGGRYVTFEVAGVSLSRLTFANILSLVARLQVPARAGMRGAKVRAESNKKRGLPLCGHKRRRQPSASIASCSPWVGLAVAQAGRRDDRECAATGKLGNVGLTGRFGTGCAINRGLRG